MRIAFVCQPWEQVTPPVQSGSIPIWSSQVSRRLARRHDVAIYSRNWRSLRGTSTGADGVTYLRLPMHPLDLAVRPALMLERRLGFPLPRRPLFSRLLFGLGYALNVSRALSQADWDIIHVHNFSQFLPLIRARNPEARIVLHMHCEWLSQLDPELVRGRLSHADAIVGCSEHVTNAIRGAFPEVADRCHTVNNGIDAEKFKAGPQQADQRGRGRLVFVGRVSPEKGVHVLLDAMRLLVKRFPQLELKIVGPVEGAPYEFIVLLSDDPLVGRLARFWHPRTKTEQYSSYMANAVDASLINRVQVHGPVPYDEISGHYSQADIAIVPSVGHEPFGMPVLEGMAAGLPVVATASGGIPEVLEDGYSGLIVERGDSASLARAIRRLLEEPELRKAMGANGQKVALGRSWDHIAARLDDIYERLVDRPVSCP